MTANAPPDSVVCFETEWYLTSIALADVNRDDTLDVIAGISSPFSKSNIYLNNGNKSKPAFDDLVQFGVANDRELSLAAGDMDNDGDIDVIAGYGGAQNVVYVNSGLWNLADPRFYSSNFTGKTNVVVGDLNSDRYLDIVVGNDSGAPSVYMNDKESGYYEITPFTGDHSANNNYIALGGMNDDPYLDIVIASGSGTKNSIYLNNGQGEFVLGASFGRVDDNTQSIVLGDLNADGYLDIVVETGLMQIIHR